MPNGITPSYSQSLSDWFSSLSDYGYGGLPGEYTMTPEELLSQWGMSQIPGSPGYEMYEGILPTYPGFREQYGVQNYLLNLEKMSQATGTARGKLGRSIALTGEVPTHGFEEAGVDTAKKVQERKTIADVMKSVIEQENIGRAGAEWDLAGKVIGGRKGWERDVSSAYQRYLATDPIRRGDCPPDDFGNPQYLQTDNTCRSDAYFENLTNPEFYDVAASHNCDIGDMWITDDPGCNEWECPGQCVDPEGILYSPDDTSLGACWPDPPDCPDGTCSLEHIDNDCDNEIETNWVNPFN